ncbi:hypothetical protein SERLA73DRAFT_186477 [Serpula lacrymans var. lacrymans S7.3]|uniref:Prokaryotic-type class I peptide chain release factors domain-containing protein n=2 Tax=Serpula lacrymans var. lacrymans TaxID=341189 RepID=F8Q7C4_SERL3|nr:uncharacterized protein SERLADRAFT_475544 [Serpula lacrymans var. lacrymans S7.9]EGN95462.1 hypothetical protein SERLA73DRAFT_186477 [Serpula lacrymans var. lacrymans S7.3]EGO20990.1 hypothetical protein SERLADRAFT_475544 [Serpula lacrymans var. lacrymans S7.9]
MSVAPALKASARAAYRNLLRASAFTFRGDAQILRAFRLKMRTETLAITSGPPTDAVLEEKTKLAREIAGILRKNVVQARRVSGNGANGEDVWSLRMTKDTELGDNATIKNPPPMQSSRRARKQEKDQQQGSAGVAQPKPAIPRNLPALKKAHQQRKIPELREEDIEESFVRGSGPGGQSINKTENNVQIIHKPTGLRVTCQETRSLQTNRKLARRILLEKLDKIQNPGLSKGELQRAKQQERERQRRKKSRKKAKTREKEGSDVES